MTPRECMKLQLDRWFACTLGCAELEEIGRKVLLDLCKRDMWDSWLRRSDYTSRPNDDDGINNWSHSHWAGEYYPCIFARFAEFHESDKNIFKVTQEFIDAMHFAENV